MFHLVECQKNTVFPNLTTSSLSLPSGKNVSSLCSNNAWKKRLIVTYLHGSNPFFGCISTLYFVAKYIQCIMVFILGKSLTWTYYSGLNEMHKEKFFFWKKHLLSDHSLSSSHKYTVHSGKYGQFLAHYKI